MIRSRGGDGGGGVIQRTRTSLTASRTGKKEKRMDTNQVGLQNWEIR